MMKLFQPYWLVSDEIVSTVLVSEFNLSHLEPGKRLIVLQQLQEFERRNLFSEKKGQCNSTLQKNWLRCYIGEFFELFLIAVSNP